MFSFPREKQVLNFYHHLGHIISNSINKRDIIVIINIFIKAGALTSASFHAIYLLGWFCWTTYVYCNFSTVWLILLPIYHHQSVYSLNFLPCMYGFYTNISSDTINEYKPRTEHIFKFSRGGQLVIDMLTGHKLVMHRYSTSIG